MRQILMCAKGLALEQSDSQVDMRHVLWATELLTFADVPVQQQFAQELRNVLEPKPPECPAAKEDVLQLLAAAASAPAMPMDPFITELVRNWGGTSKQLTLLVSPSPETAAATPNTAQPQAAVEKSESPVETEENDGGLSLEHIATVKAGLQACVMGQDPAIEALTDALAKGTYQTKQGGPLGVFLFVGPSATGKTFLAEKLAQKMGIGWKHISVSMAGLTHESQSADLDGTEPNYNNARPGRLTTHVRKHPRSVVVFEDPDKAHPAVLARLVPMLTSGFMPDRFGFYPENNPKLPPLTPPEVDFQQTLVIFITRAGEAAYDDPSFQQLTANHPDQAADMVLDELRLLQSNLGHTGGTPQFVPGLMDRLAAGRVLLFSPLRLEHLSILAKRAFDETSALFLSRLGCQVVIPDANQDLIFKALVLSQGPEPDVRRVQQAVSTCLFDPITDHMLAQGLSTPSHFKRVEWRLADGARAQLMALLKELGTAVPLHGLMRRCLKLKWQFQLASDGETLLASVTALTRLRVTQAGDVRGQGAVRVEVPAVSFSQIAGHHRVKERLKEVVRLMKNPERIKALEVSVPKGVLLYGPPGTGKTMIAKALAHEADLPFMETTGSELLDLEFMKLLFQRARKYAPSLVFIDEIDALGRRDKGGFGLLINQLLIELDGFDTSLSEPVFVVAATNLKDKLDPALIRAGRIDIHVEVPQLDRDARAYFVERYLALPNDGSLQRDVLLDQTSGMSGADLEQARREVVLEMVRLDKALITQAMLLEQVNLQKYGPLSNAKRNELHREMTAYHEAGHAVMSMVLNPDVVIEQVTITARGEAGGFVSFEQNSEVVRRMTRKEFIDEICVLLAGRLAEQMKFGDDGISAGASSDLARATKLAEAAITQYGLDEKVGLVATMHLSASGQAGFEALVAERVTAWLAEAEKRCQSELRTCWEKLTNVAEALLKFETMSATELRSMLKNTDENNIKEKK
jgi:ATP-dependent Zn protease